LLVFAFGAKSWFALLCEWCLFCVCFVSFFLWWVALVLERVCVWVSVKDMCQGVCRHFGVCCCVSAGVAGVSNQACTGVFVRRAFGSKTRF